jgi:hypothetical protein
MWKRFKYEKVKVEKGNDNVKNVGLFHIQISFDFPKDIQSTPAFLNKSINEN